SGHRLVCFGSELAHNDIPDSILSSEERTQYFGITDGHDHDSVWENGFANFALPLHRKMYLDVELRIKARKRNCQLDYLHASTLCRLLESFRCGDIVVVSTAGSTNHILRNLTKHECAISCLWVTLSSSVYACPR
ncbi:unnamed protein product, partial [Mycena citricolor]